MRTIGIELPHATAAKVVTAMENSLRFLLTAREASAARLFSTTGAAHETHESPESFFTFVCLVCFVGHGFGGLDCGAPGYMALD